MSYGHWTKECYKRKREERENKVKPGIGGALIQEVILSMATTKTTRDKWYIDTGATHHMSGRRD